jgi:ATP-binding cassette, subfamily C (CFTR/MRP), member 1
MVRQSAEVESLMVSVERSLEYSRIEGEQDASISRVSLPRNWPQTGSFEFRNVSMKYDSSSADYSLKDISFSVADKQKIGKFLFP